VHIVDRRLNPSSKSLENRQRFLRRARAQVQRAVNQNSQSRDIGGVLEGGEISIPLDGVHEPRFHRGLDGMRDFVHPGNKHFVEGDVLPRPAQGGGRRHGSAGEGEDEDAFRFSLSPKEFLDLFLDDLELPELVKRRLAEVEHEGVRRAGYSVAGSPANISVKRTMQLAMARRIALRRPRPQLIKQLQEAIEHAEDEERSQALKAEVDALEAKVRRIPFIDPIDIRYRRFENEPKLVTQAVMFCLMDVSGSMSEHMKDLAKRFYMLLYVFLTRRYRNVEVVFIRHTDRAEEVDEETFFHSPASGGTLVSSALEAMQRIITARYPPADFNIYGAQASDGDNVSSDAERTGQLLQEAILPVTQYFAYIEVGESDQELSNSVSSLWAVYDRLHAADEGLAMRKVSSRGEIFPVFQSLFQRQRQRMRVVR
jgi:uncharacterized sporulation protein YeaH/YhbH (DUF444 family)